MNRCIICNRTLNDKILQFSNMPRAAQNMPTERELTAEEGITLSLYECPACGLIQFDAPPVEYYKDVIRATKVSLKFRKLRIKQYAHFIDMFHLEGKSILEVGCGGGEFLEIFNEFPIKAVGLEHNRKLVDNAKNAGLYVVEGFIDSESDILEEGPFDGFVSFNFLEHQPNPNGMLRGIYENLSENGVGLLTVPSFDFFQEQASYYEFLRDHIAYYTEASMERILKINGFDIIEMNRFNGDTLEVYVRKRPRIQLVDYEEQRNSLERAINTYLQEISDYPGEILIWGASHQAFTILSTIQFKQQISAVVDSASFKWGKYTPASHIPIISPDMIKNFLPKCFIIMAPGFSDEIYETIIKITPKINRVLTIIDGKAILLR